jgi:hypothetical protein
LRLRVADLGGAARFTGGTQKTPVKLLPLSITTLTNASSVYSVDRKAVYSAITSSSVISIVRDFSRLKSCATVVN